MTVEAENGVFTSISQGTPRVASSTEAGGGWEGPSPMILRGSMALPTP